MVVIGPKSAVLGLLAPWWAKFGWPMAATARRFGSRSHSTFFFHMDPLTSDGGPGCYLELSKIGPSMGPYR